MSEHTESPYEAGLRELPDPKGRNGPDPIDERYRMMKMGPSAILYDAESDEDSPWIECRREDTYRLENMV